MTLDIFSIHDKKAQLFARPFFLQNIPVAIRALTSQIDHDPEMSKHADDYACFRIGSFDESVGHIEAYEVPEHVTEMRAIKDLADKARIDPNQTHMPFDELTRHPIAGNNGPVTQPLTRQ